jgi:gliding-associated putative ABC transporter substrate-binding component GldG
MKKKQKLLWWIGLVAALLAINFIASAFHQRFDLTEDKRYSLTQTTRDLLSGLEHDLDVTVFLRGDFPAGFRRLSNTTEEFMRVLKETNNERINYRFISPDDDAGNGKSWGDSLRAMGVEPINLTVQVKSGQESKLVFPIAIASYNGQSSLVSLYQGSTRVITPSELNNAEAMMEYQFTSSVDKMINYNRPFVAYATGNGESVQADVADLEQVVSSRYQMFTFNLKTQPTIPDTMKVLLIVKPTESFSADEKLKIDQYLMRGGKVLMFIDNLHAEPDSLSYKEQLIAYDRNLNLNDILFNYGVRPNLDLVMDLQCDFLPFAVGGSRENPQWEFLHWNYYPLFESRNNHVINKNIGLIAGRFVNSIDTIEVEGIRKTFLLQSSANSRTISTPALISPNENRNTPEDALFNKKDIPVAVLLEGKFPSLYRNRVSRAQQDSLAAFGGFRAQSNENAKLIVVADGDMVMNDVSQQQGPLPMGVNLFTTNTQYEYQFANRDFLLNCLEYMTSKNTIIATRNKEIVLRSLDTRKVEAERSMWQMINIALPIFLVIVFAFAYQFFRKRRYAS